MQPSATITPLFETPLIVGDVPSASKLNDRLRQAIADKRRTDPGVIKSNRLGWQSDTAMLRWGGEEARALAQHFVTLCERFTADPRPEDPARPGFLWILDMWANVSSANASNEYHSHPGAVWSAVYYVDDGYAGSSDLALGGELVFQDPRMPMARMLPLDLRYRSPEGEIYRGEHALRPASGLIVMFPPWLQHSVRPYFGTGERISVAMNATGYQPQR